MSSSSALAAARKRRGVGIQENIFNKNIVTQEIEKIKQPITIPQLLSHHDAKIYNLERLIKTKENNLIAKIDLDNLYNDLNLKITNIVDENKRTNIVTNKIEEHSKNIETLNNTTKSLNKVMSETKTTNSLLQATVSKQTKEIESLKSMVNKLMNDFKNVNSENNKNNKNNE